MGDEPAQRDAGSSVEDLQHRSQNGSADILKVIVCTGRPRRFQRRHQVLVLIVDTLIEPELVNDVTAFRPGSGDADSATPFYLRKLTDDRADGARRRGDDHGFAGFWLS